MPSRSEPATKPPARSVRVVVPDFLVGPLAARIDRAWPGATLVGVDADGNLASPADDAVALLRYFPNDRYASVFRDDALDRLLDRLPALALLQSHGVGVDGLLTPRLRASGVTLCNGASVHSRPMAESVLALVLAAAKRIPFHVRNQADRRWQRTAKDELHGAAMTIVGYGRIGVEVARLAVAFGLRVTGVRRRVAEAAPLPGIDVVGVDRLDDALASADWVVLALPLDETTRGLISAARLDRMKRSACLVNVARGEVVDEDALYARLADGRLACACLDTFREEPLSAGHRWWSLPNVLITPHNSASSPHMESRVLDLFVDNLARLARGEPLINVVHAPSPGRAGRTPARAFGNPREERSR